ncbi:MAG: hypothetical protein OCC49_04090 [Fibrobacterales bacterium]
MQKLPFTIQANWKHLQGLQKDPKWKNTTQEKGIVYSALCSGINWNIRMNNFPDEPVYTLIVDDEEIIHFDEWPEFWKKPQ